MVAVRVDPGTRLLLLALLVLPPDLDRHRVRLPLLDDDLLPVVGRDHGRPLLVQVQQGHVPPRVGDDVVQVDEAGQVGVHLDEDVRLLLIVAPDGERHVRQERQQGARDEQVLVVRRDVGVDVLSFKRPDYAPFASFSFVSVLDKPNFQHNI